MDMKVCKCKESDEGENAKRGLGGCPCSKRLNVASTLYASNNLLSLVKGVHHLHHLLPPVDNILALLHQVVENVRLVQLLQQLLLQVLLGVVDQSQHHGFRNHIDHLALDDVEVGVDERFWMSKRKGTRSGSANR
jgi:hypothetical protein